MNTLSVVKPWNADALLTYFATYLMKYDIIYSGNPKKFFHNRAFARNGNEVKINENESGNETYLRPLVLLLSLNCTSELQCIAIVTSGRYARRFPLRAAEG